MIENHFNDAQYDRESTRPLLLKLSLISPHYPWQTDADKFGYYLNRVTPHLSGPSSHSFLSERQVRLGEDASER